MARRMRDRTRTAKATRVVEDLEAVIDSAASRIMLSNVTASWPIEPRHPEFRMSSMPICPILFPMERTHTKVSFRDSWYFSHGHTEHHLQQMAVANSVNQSMAFGDWECSRCKKLAKWQFKPSKPCSSCAKTKATIPAYWRYKELEVEVENVKGHIDMLLAVPDPKHDRHHPLNGGPEGYRFILLDWKSASLKSKLLKRMEAEEDKKKSKKNKKNNRKALMTGGSWSSSVSAEDNKASNANSEYPLPGNAVQVSGYVAALRLIYKLNVIGWSLSYTDRGGPATSRDDFHLSNRAWSEKDDIVWKKRFRDLNAAVPASRAIQAALRDGKAPKKRHVEVVVAKRPCRSISDFEGYMKAKFYYEDSQRCSNLDGPEGCACGSDAKVEEGLMASYRKMASTSAEALLDAD